MLAFSALPQERQSREKEAVLQASIALDETKSPSSPAWLLSPSEGNLHRFTAQASCVVLDLLLPPYREPQRPCRYYSLLPERGGGAGGVVSLRRLSPSEEAAVDLPYGVRYRGFRPVDV